MEFYCQCGQVLSGDDTCVGERVQCPRCQAVLIVPADDGEVRHDQQSQSDGSGVDVGLFGAWAQRAYGITGLVLLLATAFFLGRLTSRSAPQPSSAAAPGVGQSSEQSQGTSNIQAEQADGAPEAPEPGTPESSPAHAEAVDATDEKVAEGNPGDSVDAAPAKRFADCIRRDIRLAQSGQAIALLIDPSRAGLSVEKAQAELGSKVLRAVADNAADLAGCFEVCRAFSQGQTIDGRDAGEMLHIAVFPAPPVKLPESGQVLMAFVPGEVTRTTKLTNRFGEPPETALWADHFSGDDTLSGLIRWWGQVGITASPYGQITGVLLRGGLQDSTE